MTVRLPSFMDARNGAQTTLSLHHTIMSDTTPIHWTPDDSQQAIIGLAGGRHLVLAPPGCGKTQILAERVNRAHDSGVEYGDMLCLTFTNRAARGMHDRIQQNTDHTASGQIFVGNVHRFCSHYLFENHVVPAETAVIDEDTMVSIMAMYLQEDEEHVFHNHDRRRRYNEIMFFSHFMEELAYDFPREWRQHPDCVTPDDVRVLRALCQAVGEEFTAAKMLDIYEHNDYYIDVAQSPRFDVGLRQAAMRTLPKMKFAHAYRAYKTQNNLVDFEDLLICAYVSLRDDKCHKRYPWIQVDEVQDLNRLQLAIINELWTGEPDGAQAKGSCCPTLLYLGDEQQAIFSFMGAKLETLAEIKRLCLGTVHHLHVNHRSPKYLVDMLNRFAVSHLGADPDLLPRPCNNETPQPDDMQLRDSHDIDCEYQDVARFVRDGVAGGFPGETTAVIVNSNNDADSLSSTLARLGVSHFKVSGTDIFATPSVKVQLAHLSVLANEHNFIAWSRLLHGMHICETEASARRWLHQLRVRAICPTDLLRPTDDTYLQAFIRTYDEEDIVVFDTETTGLNVFEDDIIQIAAEKIRQGRSIAKFSVHIETDRPIPERLGNIANPIIEERRHQAILSHSEALRQFLNFAGKCVLLGHNAEYDYRIMDYNLRRYLPDVDWQREHPQCLDSLKLIRLLRPDLKAYKLKMLLSDLHLEGENSHLADDDVNATVSLINYCHTQGQDLCASQRDYLSSDAMRQRVGRFRRAYQAFHGEATERLYCRDAETSTPALVAEMQRWAEMLKEKGWWRDTPKIDYVYRFLAGDIIDSQREPSLKEQLDHHIMELNTFKEADLCSSTTIPDRIFISTIHKAKGLEFDNVVVLDVVDGRIPNFYNEGKPELLAEDARKLYVAMSRAKRRLIVWWSRAKQLSHSERPQRLSRFMDCVKTDFA